MKQLFLISKCSRTSRYGVGTYVKLLVNCFDTSLWQIYVIELDAPDNEQSSSIENNIHYFKIANPIEINRVVTSRQVQVLLHTTPLPVRLMMECL